VEEINERLAEYEVIGLDTSVFIYHFQEEETHLPVTRAVLRGIEAGQWQGVISTVTMMELTTHPWRLNRRDVVRRYEALLANFPNLHLVEITRDVARQAAQLRAIYNLPPTVALSMSAALLHEATAWVTQDEAARQIEPMLDVVVLEECVSYEF
jgi:predicted nucleic acid-binding protein